jgi:hypothetical protein
MKLYSPLKAVSAALLVLIATLSIFDSCKPKKGGAGGGDDTGNINVNPDFEKTPPPVGDISIRQLADNKDGNVLFVADFGKALGDQKFHAVMVGDEKLVLRDDGKSGDETAGDGKFSLVLKEDIDALNKQLSESKRSLVQEKELISFDGRMMVHTPIEKTGLREFEKLDLKIPFKLPPFLPCFPMALIKKENSLMITDKTVVEDTSRTFNPCNGTGNPNGAWSFPHLITEMTGSSGVAPKDFLLKWLETWTTNQVVNEDTILLRSQINQIINTWKTASNGTFDIKFAPFKLLAIVNRVDLRGNSGYGFGNPGEGRFVFCAVRCNGQVLSVFNNPAPFMVIFEYGIPKKSCTDLQAFAKQWADLSGMVLGSAPYNDALQKITDQFTAANTSPSKPNGSSLNQLRTNELALGAGPWELREFNIDATTHLLVNVTVKQEPQTSFNDIHIPHTAADVQIMANFVNTNTVAVENNTYTVPLMEGGQHFLAGKAHTMNPSTYHWDGTEPAPGPSRISSDKARFVFSLNTCSGCHGGEAFTGNFMHVAPGGPTGVPAILSKFLTGVPPMSSTPFFVTDRANRPPAPAHEFNDLERRKIDLRNFVSCPCKPSIRVFALAEALRHRPINMTH